MKKYLHIEKGNLAHSAPCHIFPLLLIMISGKKEDEGRGGGGGGGKDFHLYFGAWVHDKMMQI